ncbi:MAG: FHA domain-containing protein [Chloroflexi bacterium]|nr:FHA domain-containing protein [Chloroflexota bacterium]
MPKKFHRLAIAIVFLFSLFALPFASHAQSGSTFFITGVDASNFPDVQFTLRAVDLNNQAIANLNNSNVSVFENGQLVEDIEVTPQTGAPVNIVFVIDLGRLANYQSFGLNNIRLAISTLVTGGYFADGIDTVTVLGRQNIASDQTLVLLPPTHSGLELTNWAANSNFQRGNGSTKGLLGVEDGMTKMAELVPTPGTQTTALIFITRYIEDPSNTVAVSSAQNLALTAKDKFITIHTFQTDLSKFNAQPLQVLASGATGVYVPLDRNTIATATGNVYQSIAAQRTVYTVAYRSQLGESGKRQITINAPEPPAVGLTGSYEVTVKAPTVEIVAPIPGDTIRREAARGADGTTLTFDVNTVTVRADVSWPEGTSPRAIQSAELYVGDVLQDKVSPPPDATQVEFTWDISDIVTEGLNTSRVEVRVTDELNVEASGDATVNVEVILPPPPPPPDPTQEFLKQYGAILGVVVCVGLAGVVLVVGVVAVAMRPKQAKQQAAAASGPEPMATLIGGAPVREKGLATLTVLEGPKGVIGEEFNITKNITILGRNPKSAHIVFYPGEESSVSRVHCTIQLDNNSFIITDNNSSSGTRINGEWLKPNDPVQLRDGDEVILGDLAKLGVKLRFNLQGGQEQPRGSSSIDRTFIIGDSQDDDWRKFQG